MKTLVYFDKGVDPLSVRQLTRLLPGSKRIKAQQLIDDEWETDLLVMPGGLDYYYHRSLQGKGCEKIRAFVENGGTYLGICAGAYFGSSIVDFEEKIEERELNFFPGRAHGPALGLGTFDFTSRKGAAMADIVWGDRQLTIFYNGGCRFIDSDQCTVHARYAHDETPVIIECAVGQGKAILCGVHPEYSAATVGTTDPYVNALRPALERHEADRAEVFELISKKL